jgi:hypothetical protein
MNSEQSGLSGTNGRLLTAIQPTGSVYQVSPESRLRCGAGIARHPYIRCNIGHG